MSVGPVAMLWPRLAAAAYLAAGGVSALDRPCPAGTAATERGHGRGTEISCTTAAGVRHGPFVILDRAGVMVGRGEHNEGRVTGLWQSWHENHRKAEEGQERRAAHAYGTLHPDPGVDDGLVCGRSDGIWQGPAMAWWNLPRRLAFVGSYCDGEAQGRRPFEGLREELRLADAVIRVRFTEEVRVVDPPPAAPPELPAARVQVRAVVKKSLYGSLGHPGQPIELFFPGQHARRSRHMPRYASSIQFWNGPRSDYDQTALVKREADGLVLLNVLGADDGLRTDQLLSHYAALARSDDRAFALGLAQLLGAIVRSDPDRVVWEGWIPIVFGDWDRLPDPAPTDDPAFKRMVTETLRTVVGQIQTVAGGGQDWLNLHHLPWLIRFLSETQRRGLAQELLGLHVVAQRELEGARQPLQQQPAEPPHPLRELSWEQVRAMWADAGLRAVIQCLALCVDPRLQAPPPADTVERARAFVADR